MRTPEYVNKRVHIGAFVVAAMCCVGALLYLTPVKHMLFGTWFNKAAFVVLPLFPAVMGVRRSREVTGSISTAFRMGGMAMFANSGFGLLVAFFPHLTDPRQIPAIDLLFALAVYVPGVVAAVWATAERRSLGYILDGVLATSSFMFIGFGAFLPEISRQFNGDSRAILVALASPLFDAIMVTVALMAARRGTPLFSRQAVLCFAFAEALDGANDITWAYKGMHTPMPSLCMFFWVAHTMVLFVTFMMPSIDNTKPQNSPSVAYLLFPYLPPVLAGLAAIRLFVRHDTISLGTGIVGGIVLASLIARQVAAVLDHAHQNLHVAQLTNTVQQRDEQIEHLVLHDHLTSLPNRRFLNNQVMNSQNTNDDFVVMLIDVDDFKTINDSLGHAAGDELLMYVADILRTSVREGDTVVRLGGDEFAVLLENTTVEQATEIAERMVTSLHASFEFAGLSVNVASSIGLASGTSLDFFDTIMRQANMAMYERKAAKTKGGVSFFKVN